jgi:hypothetical protein
MHTQSRENWLNRWAMGKTGRNFFKYMAAPNPQDSINDLNR